MQWNRLIFQKINLDSSKGLLFVIFYPKQEKQLHEGRRQRLTPSEYSINLKKHTVSWQVYWLEQDC